MKDIFKSVSWGLMLLVMIVVLVFTGAFTVMAPVNIYISSQKEAANSRLAAEVMPALDYLEQEYGTHNKNYGLTSRTDIKKAREFVEQKVKECNASGGCSNVYAFGLFEYSRILDFKSNLRHISQRDSVASTNGSLLFSCVFSFLTFVLSIYSIYALARYKRLGVKGELIFFSLLAPVIGLSLSLMFVNEYKGLEKYFTFNGVAMGWAMFFIISPFLLYPPAIITARKAGIKVVDVLKLNNVLVSHEQPHNGR
jgi:ABC-type glycerol-3-phosphate transport system permease component